MSIHLDAPERFSQSSSFADTAHAARSALSEEFFNHAISAGSERTRVAQGDEPVVIHLPAPEPAPEVYHGVKDGKPFTVTIEPWEPHPEKR
ncbi:MAG: hypothetical protein K2Y39_21035 [Candidatus Obscuribacterales bacterium]|nr:hypothetical protein [Candidatus Obscuribacterales bacterium]